MAYVNKAEKTLKPLFKDFPVMPKGGKDWFVKASPILALILAAIQLLSAWSLWHVGRIDSSYTNYANNISSSLGGGAVLHGLNVFYWISLVTVTVSGVLLLMAYTGLKDKTRDAWDKLFLVGLINVAYGLFSIFDSYYGGVGNFVGAIIISAIGFYILFQIQPYYTHKVVAK